MNNNEFGKFLKFKRGDKSLRNFADFLEISHSYLDSLEKGKDPKTKKEINISSDLLQRMSTKLNVSVDALLQIISGKDFEKVLDDEKYQNEIKTLLQQDGPFIPSENDMAFFTKIDSEEEAKEQKLILQEKGKQHFNELELLFDKYKDVLTESDKTIIKTIIEQRKKEIDNELGGN